MPFHADPSRCRHRYLPHGYDFLSEPPRQCPECGLWLETEYDESWDGEEEQCSFWLTETSPPQGAVALDRETIEAVLAHDYPTWSLVEDDAPFEDIDVHSLSPRPGRASAMVSARTPDGSVRTVILDELGVVASG